LAASDGGRRCEGKISSRQAIIFNEISLHKDYCFSIDFFPQYLSPWENDENNKEEDISFVVGEEAIFRCKQSDMYKSIYC
jgi:hypothetical protein